MLAGCWFGILFLVATAFLLSQPTSLVCAMRGGSDADDGLTLTDTEACFRRADFDVMFSLPRSKVEKTVYPTVSDLRERLWHTEGKATGLEEFDPSVYNDKYVQEVMEAMKQMWNPFGDRASKLSNIRSVHQGELRFIVEVGSFVGSSAIYWASQVKGTGAVLAIDSWLGTPRQWLSPGWHTSLALQHGSPRLYQVFLARMLQHNLTDTVLPLRTNSIVGAHVLNELPYVVDLLYLDTSHLYGETFMELMYMWPLVRPGGTLAGDDYDWKEVAHDVQLFATVIGQQPQLLQQWQWAFVKPPASSS